MNFKIISTIIIIGYFILMNIIPTDYSWLRIILLIIFLLWIWFGRKIIDNKK